MVAIAIHVKWRTLLLWNSASPLSWRFLWNQILPKGLAWCGLVTCREENRAWGLLELWGNTPSNYLGEWVEGTLWGHELSDTSCSSCPVARQPLQPGREFIKASGAAAVLMGGRRECLEPRDKETGCSDQLCSGCR